MSIDSSTLPSYSDQTHSRVPSGGCLSPGECRSELPAYHKRAFAHNYFAPFIYHIIIKKRDGFESFGVVKGDARIPHGNPGCAYIEESEIGKIIAKETLLLQKIFPILQIYQFKVMPDHVHILLNVKQWSRYHLDFYVESLRNNVAESYSKAIGKSVVADKIFQPGYCDKPLLLKRSLDGLFRYIRENPHRLAMRRQYPLFFRHVRKFKIGEADYTAYGNLFLFRNPDRIAVKIGRKFTDEEKEQYKAECILAVSSGSVLVSPFISKAEKEIRAEAESLGGKIIYITHEAFPERFKPSAHDFDLCSKGRLLIISLGFPPGAKLTRSLCIQMNSLAENIANLKLI